MIGIRRYGIPLGFLLYALFSLWSLSWYPAVHSDEVWLASLTRTMMEEGTVAATEEFFSLTQRHPHALKTLYHLIQMPFLAVQFSHLAARLPALLAVCVGMFLFYRIVAGTTGNTWVAAATAFAFGMDPQILYISHFGRQESLILLVILGGLAAITSSVSRKSHAPSGGAQSTRSAVTITGTIVGLGVFVHPNAFIAAAVLTPWVLRRSWVERRDLPPGRRLAVGMTLYLIPLLTAAVAAVAASLAMDFRFPVHYMAFGSSVGVSDNYLQRFFRLISFFRNLITRNQGTYYLPPVTTRLLAIGALPVVTGFVVLGRKLGRKNSNRTAGKTDGSTPLGLLSCSLISTAVCIIALYLIGKYSPPSIVFLFPFIYLAFGGLAGYLLSPQAPSAGVTAGGVTHGGVTAAVVVLAATVAMPLLATAAELGRWHPGTTGDSYASFISEIRRVIEENDLGETPVLANLNAGFAFAPGRLRAFHDLAALPPGDDVAMDRYVRDEEIAAVFLPRREMEIIYGNRPVWNDVYGNPSRFYPQLMAILGKRGTLVETIEAPVYAMRLLRYIPVSGKGAAGENPPAVEVYVLDRRTAGGVSREENW